MPPCRRCADLFFVSSLPGDIFARYAISSVSAMNPDAILLIGDIRPGIPPGIRFKNTALVSGIIPSPPSGRHHHHNTRFGALMKGRRQSSLPPPLRRNRKRRVGNRRFLSLQGPISAKMTLDGLTMEKIGYLKERLGRQITGKLKGALNYSGNPQAPAAGSGNIDLTFQTGVIRSRKTHGFR